MDLYDYGPQVDLAKPVVVTGYLTELSRAVAYRSAALLGLTFHDIDRRVEHECGQSLVKLLLLEGEGAYRESEAICLRTALYERPAGIIALSDGGLLRPASRSWVSETGSLVVLDLDLPNLYWQAKRAAARSESEAWHPLHDGAPEGMDDLRPFYQQRQDGFASADFTIDATAFRESSAAKELIRWIESGQ